MKFRTFRILSALVVVGALGGIGFLVAHTGKKTPPISAPAQSVPVVATTTLPPIASANSTALTNEEIQAKVTLWLSQHPDREGKNKLVDILPNERFRATAIRFPDADARKWSNNEKQWSQIKIDIDRDGTDDEKWLLKNGVLYKREVLDRSGKVTQTEYFH